MRLRSLFLALAVSLPAMAAHAHEVAKGPNGGKVAEVAGHHLEFTHAPGEVVIYASDEAHKPLPTAGSSGRAIIQSGGKTAQAALTPAEPNKLAAKLDAPLAAGAVVVVSATFSDGHKAQARFTVD
jgi:methionine-rich copper-binding protein CopC